MRFNEALGGGYIIDRIAQNTGVDYPDPSHLDTETPALAQFVELSHDIRDLIIHNAEATDSSMSGSVIARLGRRGVIGIVSVELTNHYGNVRRPINMGITDESNPDDPSVQPEKPIDEMSVEWRYGDNVFTRGSTSVTRKSAFLAKKGTRRYNQVALSLGLIREGVSEARPLLKLK